MSPEDMYSETIKYHCPPVGVLEDGTFVVFGRHDNIHGLQEVARCDTLEELTALIRTTIAHNMKPIQRSLAPLKRNPPPRSGISVHTLADLL